jgi:hypothetical protein
MEVKKRRPFPVRRFTFNELIINLYKILKAPALSERSKLLTDL